jgi:putative ABC transport system permease protein
MSVSAPADPRPRLVELVSEAFANLYAQRQRSVLALLGILIGTASIVAMLTIGHMAQLETLKVFRHLGVDMLQIHAMPAGNGLGVLSQRAIEQLPAHDPAVLAATPMAVDRTSISSGAQSADTGLAAITSTLQDLVLLPLQSGRFIAPVDNGNLVAVIGAQAARTLSAPGAPIELGSPLRIKGYAFTVIGVLAPVPYTALDPVDFNDAVLIPLAGAGRVMSPSDPGTALLRLRPDANVKAAGQRVSKALANPSSTLQVISARDLIREMNAQKAIHSQLLTAVGAISLLVGGIGVMNVMLMGVMERRREIGLRAAIGATPADVRLMFLAEAVTLAGAGGLAGLLLGLAAAAITAGASGWTFSLALYVLPLGPAVAALVGVAFGLYPAIMASRLSPIDALRAE